MPQLPGQAPPQVVQGTIDRVPCPHCGKANDLRVMDEQQLLDTGHTYACDWCENPFEVVRIFQIKAIGVRKGEFRRGLQRVPRAVALPQRPALGGFVGRLLGAPKGPQRR